MFTPSAASQLWDAHAAAFLAGVVAAGGEWHGKRISDPTAARGRLLAAAGYDPLGPDDKTGKGSLNARDAWRRAFVRAVYRANDPRRKGNPGPGVQLEMQVGRYIRPSGVRPGHRMVRGRCHRGDGKAWVAAHVPEDHRWDLDPGARAVPQQDEFLSV